MVKYFLGYRQQSEFSGPADRRVQISNQGSQIGTRDDNFPESSDPDVGFGMAFTAGGILASGAILASFLPARSAARVQPTQALSLE